MSISAKCMNSSISGRTVAVKMSDHGSDEKLQSAEGGSNRAELEGKEETATPESPEYAGLGTKILVTFALSIALLMVLSGSVTE
jgi:hypothetical protein